MTKVELSTEEWKNVLATMEAGIRSIGFPAFEIGGRIMASINQQINDQNRAAEPDGDDD